MRKIIFELCAETIDTCVSAHGGGAARIELCSALSEGGLTPSHGLVKAAVAQSQLPVHGLVRPRGGDFFYSAAELATIVTGTPLNARKAFESDHPPSASFINRFD